MIHHEKGIAKKRSDMRLLIQNDTYRSALTGWHLVSTLYQAKDLLTVTCDESSKGMVQASRSANKDTGLTFPQPAKRWAEMPGDGDSAERGKYYAR
jgi:hypothetical protein